MFRNVTACRRSRYNDGDRCDVRLSVSIRWCVRGRARCRAARGADGDAARTRLSDLLLRPKDRLIYEYDFGDSWEHEVTLERVGDALPDARYPRVTDGRRACPPEDVGGVPGYAEFVDAIRDPHHEEHASMLEWVGGDFDPEFFDLITANDRLPRRRTARRRDA